MLKQNLLSFAVLVLKILILSINFFFKSEVCTVLENDEVYNFRYMFVCGDMC